MYGKIKNATEHVQSWLLESSSDIEVHSFYLYEDNLYTKIMQ